MESLQAASDQDAVLLHTSLLTSQVEILYAPLMQALEKVSFDIVAAAQQHLAKAAGARLGSAVPGAEITEWLPEA